MWALFVALGTLLALSVIAGYRLQRRVNDFAAKSGTIDSLGRQLDLGRFHPLSLKLEGEAFQRDWTAFAETLPTKDEAEEWLEARPHTAIDDTHEWARNVRQLLNKYVGSSFAARFDNDAGLLPGSPPEELSDKWYVGVWQSHDMRMQRLHQIIEELTERLTAGT